MSQLTLRRYTDIDEYKKAKAGYDISVRALEELRAMGLEVYLETEIPLPPEGYPDDFIIVAKGEIQEGE
jgi:hypothetical protein